MDPTNNFQNPIEFENQNSIYVKRNRNRELFLFFFFGVEMRNVLERVREVTVGDDDDYDKFLQGKF